jgi:formylglycine-generating enzyme required for sulfatase activity
MTWMLVRRTTIAAACFVAFGMTAVAQFGSARLYWMPVKGGEMGNFFITATEITRVQFAEYCSATGRENPGAVEGYEDRPVVNITKADAGAYCEWLGKKTGSIVRLPTRDEWQYAAVGGKDGDHNVFCGSGNPGDVAWFQENADEDEYDPDKTLDAPRTHDVATRQPNFLGIYDMSGNVWEFCDPEQVANGGSFTSDGHNIFPYSGSGELDADYKAGNLGFRPVMIKK